MLAPTLGCGVPQQEDEEQEAQDEQRGPGGPAGHQGPEQRQEDTTGGLPAPLLPAAGLTEINFSISLKIALWLTVDPLTIGQCGYSILSKSVDNLKEDFQR